MNRAFSIGVEVLVISYAVFALVACGRSGSGGTSCVMCPYYNFTVGGTVSGLAGSGLVLFNGTGDHVAISANGPFTFPTKYSQFDMYSVSVSGQPLNPSQTCVVTNGNGGVGSGVTDIAVVCTTGVANAKLTGTYKVDSFGYSNGQDSDLWTLTFDGAGNFSGSDVNLDGKIGSRAVSGTYSVAADGTLTISPVDGSTITGGLSADGNTLVASQTTSGHPPTVFFAVLL